MKFTVIGNLSHDEIYTKEVTKRRMGGSAFYVASTLTALNQEVNLYTNYDETPTLLKKRNIYIQGKKVSSCVKVKIFEYKNQAYADSYGKNINYKDIPSSFFRVDCIIISTLFSELSLETLQKIKNSIGVPLALDIQGYLRVIDIQTNLVKKKKIPPSAIKGIDILKLNEEEAMILFPNLTFEQMAKALINNGQKVCLFTLGEKGAILFDRTTAYRLQTPRINPKDTVGAGDTFFAAFLKYYLYNKNISYAGNNAMQYIYSYLKNKSYE